MKDCDSAHATFRTLPTCPPKPCALCSADLWALPGKNKVPFMQQLLTYIGHMGIQRLNMHQPGTGFQTELKLSLINITHFHLLIKRCWSSLTPVWPSFVWVSLQSILRVGWSPVSSTQAPLICWIIARGFIASFLQGVIISITNQYTTPRIARDSVCATSFQIVNISRRPFLISTRLWRNTEVNLRGKQTVVNASE